ncbi:MAG: energy transducer TonB [Treponema sp.]|nr:energy transducer TonB [Treponema sp.]
MAAALHAVVIFKVIIPAQPVNQIQKIIQTAPIRLIDIIDEKDLLQPAAAPAAISMAPPAPVILPAPEVIQAPDQSHASLNQSPAPSYSLFPSEIPEAAIESIAENMIASDTVPDQAVYNGLRSGPAVGAAVTAQPAYDAEPDYLPMSESITAPVMPAAEIKKALVYPGPALRAGLQGSVYLELSIDDKGILRNIVIQRESPEKAGFGEAAVNAIKTAIALGGKIIPAKAGDQNVAVKYRYPVLFKTQ